MPPIFNETARERKDFIHGNTKALTKPRRLGVFILFNRKGEQKRKKEKEVLTGEATLLSLPEDEQSFLNHGRQGKCGILIRNSQTTQMNLPQKKNPATTAAGSVSIVSMNQILKLFATTTRSNQRQRTQTREHSERRRLGNVRGNGRLRGGRRRLGRRSHRT